MPPILGAGHDNVLLGAYDIHLRQLQGVLNAAARLIARKRKFDSISSTIRDELHGLPIRQRVVLTLNCLCLCSTASITDTQLPDEHVSASYKQPSSMPPAFCCACRPHRSTHEARVRYGPRSFAVAGPSTWNALPALLRNDELSAMSLPRHLNITLITMLVTVFTVRVGEHNFSAIILILYEKL